MTVGRLYDTATLLPNGMVLIAGGYSGYGGSGDFASADLYDSAKGTFTATSSMTVAREAHTATLLPNGKVVIAGAGNISGCLASAELYE